VSAGLRRHGNQWGHVCCCRSAVGNLACCVQLGAITVGIPFIFWLCLRRALKDDPIAVRLSTSILCKVSVFSPLSRVLYNFTSSSVWWREHREQLRLILNAPRSFVVLIIYLIGFGRVVIKYAAVGFQFVSCRPTCVHRFLATDCESGTYSRGFVGMMSSRSPKTNTSWPAWLSTASLSRSSSAFTKSHSSQDGTIQILDFLGRKNGGGGLRTQPWTSFWF
jgi:hypothetical protein